MLARWQIPLLFAATLQSAWPVTMARAQQLYAIRPAPPPATKCSLARAKRVNLRTLAAEPDKWMGKCVALDGYWEGPAIFDDVGGRRPQYARSMDVPADRRVGIYGNDKLWASAPTRPVAITAVGVAGRCEGLARGDNVMVLGYCHYTGGAYLAATEMRRH